MIQAVNMLNPKPTKCRISWGAAAVTVTVGAVGLLEVLFATVLNDALLEGSTTTIDMLVIRWGGALTEDAMEAETVTPEEIEAVPDEAG